MVAKVNTSEELINTWEVVKWGESMSDPLGQAYLRIKH